MAEGAREGLKATPSHAAYQDKRRRLALEKQKGARQERIQAKRQLLSLADEVRMQRHPSSWSDIPARRPLDRQLTTAATTPQASDDSSMQEAPLDAEQSGDMSVDGSASSAQASTSGRPPSGAGERRHSARRSFASQMQQPEWLTDVPDGLGSEW
jgi:hypothetical protein